MARNDLERLDRDTLIARAEASGVTRARILTRPELIDELLLKTTEASEDVQRVRGFFGRARDLLARVIERGLHLPDAADRLRGRSSPPPPLRSTAAPLPTVTLAEIYAAQGHRERAVETLKNVLDGEPEHGAARALIEQLEDAAYDGPKPPELPPEDEIFGSRPPPPLVPQSEAKDPPVEGRTDLGGTFGRRPQDDESMKPRVLKDDVCVALPVDPETLFVYWEVRDRTRRHLDAARPAGVWTLRLFVVTPTWDGPKSSVRDMDLRAPQGDVLVGGLPAGAVVRAAIGWRVGEEVVPIAHSPALEAPSAGDDDALPGAITRWTLRGPVPLAPGDRDAASIERAFGAARARRRRSVPVESGTRT